MNHPIPRYALAALALLAFAPAATHAQPTAPPSPTAKNPLIAQLVDSRKGYVARIPAEAILDSSRSGWSPTGMYERRIYRIANAGTIRFTVTVKPTEIPPTAVTAGGYTSLSADSSTSTGTAQVRTYYMPTRNVRIELIPSGPGMQKYIEAKETIFSSFRWKPGANTGRLDIP
jgi:hypothetical protein